MEEKDISINEQMEASKHQGLEYRESGRAFLIKKRKKG
jgi:hypothetical protein